MKALLLLAAILAPAAPALAAAPAPTAPSPAVSISFANADPQQLPLTIQIIGLLTLLSLAPALAVMVTSFTRILIVLSFTRSALGTQQIPPNAVLVGLAIFLSIFTMAPVWQRMNEQALQPYLQGKLAYDAAGERALQPLRKFMLRQTGESELGLFVKLGKLPRPKSPDDIPTYAVVPAFMIGELKRAFTMGFMIFIPFVVIDMVVATLLMSMGMMMMPPVVISMPCKLLLFVLVNGWEVVTESLVTSFH